MSKIKQCLLQKKQGYSNREIAEDQTLNPKTVNRYFRFIREHHLSIDELYEKEEPELDRIFHAGNPAYADPRMEVFLQELPYYREQLAMPHVTRKQLWIEYKARHTDGYGQSQFYFHLTQNLMAEKEGGKAVLSGSYVPGQKLYVDFAGDKLSYVNLETGEEVKVEVFVASMPFSDYGFITCVPSQKTEDFIYAVRQCLEYLGGVPDILVPDNLKAAVTKPHRYEPEVSRALRDMGNHYHFVVIPCQPRKPTQKSLVEDQVKLSYHHIYAKLRHSTYHSLRELNEAISKLLEDHNRTRMQKRPYSREENFHANEKPLLKPLPETEFEIRYNASLAVQANGCVELRRNGITHFYSVPYAHIGKRAEVIFTNSIVKVFVDGKQVAVHPRSFKYGYSIVQEHFASNNRAIMGRNSSYYIERAGKVSPDFKTYIERIFDRKRASEPEEVYYKTCDMIFSLQRRSEQDIFDRVCRLCLENDIFTGKRFESVLKNTCLVPSTESVTETPVPTDHANMRGASNYQ